MRKLNKNEWIAIVVAVALIGFFFFQGDLAGLLGGSNINMTKENNNNNMNTASTVATEGSVVTVNYTGKFADGTVFDSSESHGQPFQFLLGAGQVIKGWDQGVVGMKIGEKKTLVVPPELGYGPNDYGPIPGNSTLIFDIELLNVQNN